MLGLRFVRGLSPVAASGGHSSSRCGDRSSSRCAGLSLPRPLPLRGTGSRRAGSAVVAHGPSRSVACGIFPDQGSNPRPLHQQADSQPLRHQGSPEFIFVHGVRECSNFVDLHVAVQLSQHNLQKRLFPILYSCFLCQSLIDHRFVGIFLGSLFCAIDLYVCFCTNTTLLITVTL